jgi:peptidoglycan/LPS O-acetylase OafA/YrhL
VAIALVVAFHAFPNAVSGGFIGVDVFFVISGYLITGLLQRDAEAGNLRYGGFLMRRLRRLWASFTLMAIATTAFAWASLSPERLLDYLRALAAAVGLSSNWYFFATADYFNTNLDQNLLLHTWSLGVEEQFYLVFPLIVLVLAKRPRLLTLAVAMLGLASLGLSIGEAQRGNASGAFYATHLRCWELLGGALLARASHAGLIARSGRALGAAAPALISMLMALGVTIVLSAAFTFSESTRFPGAAALAPVGGALLCLLAGEWAAARDARSPLLLRATVEAPAARYIGRISYAWYLWHWPVLVALRMLVFDPDDVYVVLAVLLSLLLAIIAYHLIERPVHRGKLLSNRSLAAAAGMSVAAFLGVAAYGIGNRGVPGRISPAAARALDTGPDLRHQGRPCYPARDIARDFGLPAPPPAAADTKFCVLGDSTGRPPDFLLWGDSHASAIEGAVWRVARERGLTGLSAVMGGCPPVLGGGWSLLSPQDLAQCVAFNDNVERVIGAWSIQNVVLVGRWSIYAQQPGTNRAGKFRALASALDASAAAAPPPKAFSAALRASITMAAQHSKVALLLDVPTQGFSVPQAVAYEKNVALPSAAKMVAARRSGTAPAGVSAGYAGLKP